MLIAGVLVGICTVPCSGAIYLDIVAVLHASGGGADRARPARALQPRLHRPARRCCCWPSATAASSAGSAAGIGANSPWIKAGLALAVVAMSFGLLYTL